MFVQTLTLIGDGLQIVRAVRDFSSDLKFAHAYIYKQNCKPVTIFDRVIFVFYIILSFVYLCSYVHMFLLHILIFLWFAGHQTASFRDVGDRFNITISALFCVIRRVTYYLSNKSRDIIKWPSVDERVIEQHYAHKGFPGVIGSVDGTHIRIDKPENDPESYFNRKHYYSIQLQVVSDHRRQIHDVFVGFPGSVHDARIFAASPLNDTLAEKCHNNYILGDSAYPCLQNLLTPYKDNGHLTRRQVNYNAKLSMNRYVVEHSIGLLKQKFRQLFHIKLRKIPDLIHFIRSCCVLHNIALEDNFEYRIQDEENVVNEIYVPERNGVNGNQLRDHVANNVLQI